MRDIVFNGLSYHEKTKCLSSVTNGKFCANEWGRVACNRDFCNQWEKYDMECLGQQCVLKALNNNKFCSIDDKDCTKNRNDPGVEFRLSSAITGPGPSEVRTADPRCCNGNKEPIVESV